MATLKSSKNAEIEALYLDAITGNSYYSALPGVENEKFAAEMHSSIVTMMEVMRILGIPIDAKKRLNARRLGTEKAAEWYVRHVEPESENME